MSIAQHMRLARMRRDAALFHATEQWLIALPIEERAEFDADFDRTVDSDANGELDAYMRGFDPGSRLLRGFAHMLPEHLWPNGDVAEGDAWR